MEFRQSFVHESSCAALVAVVSRVMSLDVVLCVHCRVAMFRVLCRVVLPCSVDGCVLLKTKLSEFTRENRDGGETQNSESEIPTPKKLTCMLYCGLRGVGGGGLGAPHATPDTRKASWAPKTANAPWEINLYKMAVLYS